MFLQGPKKEKPSSSEPIYVKKPNNPGSYTKKIEGRVVHGSTFSPEEIKRIIESTNTNPKTSQEYNSTLAKLSFEFWSDEGHTELPDIKEFKDLVLKKSPKGILLVLSAVAILNFSTVNTSAQERPEPKQIEWALEALEGIDPIDYLLEKSAPNASVEDTKVFDDYERSLLAWNLYHEARGELSNKKENKGLEGILGQLYSVFERMKSKNFPAEPEEIVFDKAQYSWTLHLLKEEGKKDDKQKIKSYSDLREIVDKVTVGNFSESYKTIKRILLELSKRKELPESLTDYHVFGMLDSTDTNKRERYLRDIKSIDTYKRILVVDQMLIDKDPNVVMLGSLHVYYSQKLFTTDFVNKKFEEFKLKGLPEFVTKIPDLRTKK